jgi:O-antigen/teichoic acid export membrane protein
VTTTAPAPLHSALARGMSWVGASHIVRQVAWFGSLLFVATRVSPHAFGSVTAAMVLVQVAWLVVNSGTRGALVVSETLTIEQVRRALSRNLVSGTAIACGAILLSNSLLPALVPGADPLVLATLAFTIMLNGLSIVPLALLQRELRFKQHAASNAGAALGASAACIIAALAGAGVWALVARQVAFQLVLAGLAWHMVQPVLPMLRSDRASGRRDPLAKWFFATTVIGFIALNADYVIVGHLTNVRELGIYSLAFAFAFAPMTQFAWQVGTVLQPVAARTRGAELLAARAGTALRAAALLLLPAAVPAIVLAPVLLPALLGAQWEPAVAPFQLLVAAGIAQGLLAIVRQFLVGSGSVRFCVFADGACLVAGVVALAALVHAHGIIGAALAHVGIAALLLIAYGTLGARRLGSGAADLWAAVRGVVLPVVVQATVTAAWLTALQRAGAAPAVEAAAATAAGFAALLAAMRVGGTRPVAEIASLIGHRPTRPRSLPPIPAPTRIARRRPLPRIPAPTRAAAVVVVAAAVALAAGAVAVREPRMAAGAAAAALALVLAFRAPVWHVLLLITVTALVPLELQARFGTGGDINAAGVLPSDVLLLAALARAVVVLPRTPLPPRGRWAIALMAVFIAAAILQVQHALALGRPLSGVGGEFRVLLAFGILLVALPLLADPAARRQLLAGLPVVGLALGVWGVAQFAFGLRFDPPDAGQSVSTFLTGGRVVGQLCMPVAAITSLAVLTGAPPRSTAARVVLLTAFATNSLAVVLTFERTVLVVTLLGFALVFLRGTGRQRLRIVAWAPPALAAGLIVLALTSPTLVPTYAQRVASLTSLSADPSLGYRIEESRVVGRQIAERSLTGSGLGATILIGRPGTNLPLKPRRFAENGYQWLAWKMGIPVAALLCSLLALAILARGRRDDLPLDLTLRLGCQAALAALAVVTLAFPSFNDLEVAPVVGLLAALALSRPPQRQALA